MNCPKRGDWVSYGGFRGFAREVGTRNFKMAAKLTYYEILGVSRESSEKEVTFNGRRFVN